MKTKKLTSKQKARKKLIKKITLPLISISIVGTMMFSLILTVVGVSTLVETHRPKAALASMLGVVDIPSASVGECYQRVNHINFPEPWQQSETRGYIVKVLKIGRASYKTFVYLYEDTTRSGYVSASDFSFFHSYYPEKVTCPPGETDGQ